MDKAAAQALQLLDGAVAQAPLTRRDHVNAQAALEYLSKYITNLSEKLEEHRVHQEKSKKRSPRPKPPKPQDPIKTQ